MTTKEQQEDSRLAHFPEAVKALACYLEQNKPGKRGRAGTYKFKVLIAKDRTKIPRRYEFGLKTRYLAEAVKRAGELVALFHFHGWQVANKHINAYTIADYFPLSDLSDDLGRDRDDEETPGFYGGNAGLPFLICWPKDADIYPARPCACQ